MNGIYVSLRLLMVINYISNDPKVSNHCTKHSRVWETALTFCLAMHLAHVAEAWTQVCMCVGGEVRENQRQEQLEALTAYTRLPFTTEQKGNTPHSTSCHNNAINAAQHTPSPTDGHNCREDEPVHLPNVTASVYVTQQILTYSTFNVYPTASAETVLRTCCTWM